MPNQGEGITYTGGTARVSQQLGGPSASKCPQVPPHSRGETVSITNLLGPENSSENIHTALLSSLSPFKLGAEEKRGPHVPLQMHCQAFLVPMRPEKSH